MLIRRTAYRPRVNGLKLKTQRVELQPFAVANPPGNIWGPDACGTGVPLEPGIYSPGIADGYWATIENLKASSNPYTIYFHGESGGTVEDITYCLTVTPAYSEVALRQHASLATGRAPVRPPRGAWGAEGY